MRLDRDGTGWKARFQFREMHTFSEQLRAYFPKTNNQDEKKKKVSGGGGREGKVFAERPKRKSQAA